jgi:hypothetical protein
MSTERWVIVKEDGTILLHEENDGWTFMRRGAEATERVIALEELKKSYSPRHYEDALRQLAALDLKRKATDQK